VFATMRDIASRNAPAAQRLSDWSTSHGRRLDVLELDVLDEQSVSRAIAQVTADGNGIDVVVNNAGASAIGPLEAFSVPQMEAIFSLNALGPMRVCKAVLPTMRARRSGLIVFITSTLGRVLPFRGGLYPATKWAEEGLAESLHYQVAPFGIDVAIVEPGSFPTAATSKAMSAEDAAIAAEYAATSPHNNAPSAPPRLDAERPDPQEVADAIRSLVGLPAGHRPLRTVVGPVFTEGVAAYNAVYEQTRDHLNRVLDRPDQAITWSR
jgi:NAD(P)-dependent dehydrogenase (short-subunit alcohol dehydrogenase family)